MMQEVCQNRSISVDCSDRWKYNINSYIVQFLKTTYIGKLTER